MKEGAYAAKESLVGLDDVSLTVPLGYCRIWAIESEE
jgi:hypothetical protein